MTQHDKGEGMGRTFTEKMRNPEYREAYLSELVRERFVMSSEQWAKFEAMLANPPEPTPALNRLLAMYRKIIEPTPPNEVTDP